MPEIGLTPEEVVEIEEEIALARQGARALYQAAKKIRPNMKECARIRTAMRKVETASDILESRMNDMLHPPVTKQKATAAIRNASPEQLDAVLKIFEQSEEEEEEPEDYWYA